MIRALGVEIVLNSEITSIAGFREKGFGKVIIATGAWRPGKLSLEYGDAINVISFLDGLKNNPEAVMLGKHVAVIGGGNAAIDAARAAKRASGVEKVSLVYRRNKRYMPADEEDFDSSKNEGFLMLGGDGKRVRVRLDGKTADYNFDDSNPPPDILLLIKTVAGKYAYMIRG